MTNIFEQASRLKLRFASTKGELTTEDLWDLPLTSEKGSSLDNIGTALMHKLNAQPQSLIGAKTESSARDNLAFEVIKSIISTKQAENAQARTDAEQKAIRQRAKELLAQRKDKALETLTDEQLEALAKG